MEDYTHLAGHRFPGGSYALPPWLSWCGRTPPAGAGLNTAHQGLAYLVALRGAGVSIQDIFDLMGANADSGVVFWEFQVDYHGVLRPGATYECEAEVIEVERKSGKRAGVFDKFTFQVRVREGGTEGSTCVCTNSWIFPRAEGE